MIAVALEAYKTDTGSTGYPRLAGAEDLYQCLSARTNGTIYMTTEEGSFVDSWDNEIEYRVAADGQSYALVSAGPDGRFDTQDDLSLSFGEQRGDQGGPETKPGQ